MQVLSALEFDIIFAVMKKYRKRIADTLLYEELSYMGLCWCEKTMLCGR